MHGIVPRRLDQMKSAGWHLLLTVGAGRGPKAAPVALSEFQSILRR
jgi:hypothetical protein